MDSRKRPRAGGLWLGIGGVCASIAAGLLVAHYAVGGIDPFYKASHRSGWAAASPATTDTVAVTHDDLFLPSAAIATTTPYTPTPPRDSAGDWQAVDARAQPEVDRAPADDPMNDLRTDNAAIADPLPDPAPPVRAAPAPRPAVTPGDTLIY